MYINYIFESESCFENNEVVNLNIFAVRHSFENLKKAMDIPWEKKTWADAHTLMVGRCMTYLRSATSKTVCLWSSADHPHLNKGNRAYRFLNKRFKTTSRLKPQTRFGDRAAEAYVNLENNSRLTHPCPKRDINEQWVGKEGKAPGRGRWGKCIDSLAPP